MSPLAAFCMTAEDPSSVLMCVVTPSLTESLSWSLHAQPPHSQPSQISHAALDSVLRIRCGDRFLSWQPSRPLSAFSYSHTKVENTVAELRSPWPCGDRALCLPPHLLSWPQNTLLCPGGRYHPAGVLQNGSCSDSTCIKLSLSGVWSLEPWNSGGQISTWNKFNKLSREIIWGQIANLTK